MNTTKKNNEKKGKTKKSQNLDHHHHQSIQLFVQLICLFQIKIRSKFNVWLYWWWTTKNKTKQKISIIISRQDNNRQMKIYSFFSLLLLLFLFEMINYSTTQQHKVISFGKNKVQYKKCFKVVSWLVGWFVDWLVVVIKSRFSFFFQFSSCSSFIIKTYFLIHDG